MTLVNFTPLSSSIGGLMIGIAAAGMLLITGRIAGVSGIAAGLLLPSRRGDRLWRWLFVAGLMSAGAVLAIVMPHAFAVDIERSSAAVVVAGLLVGVGTSLGSGCTSGHGVCGIGRWSLRSIVATLLFIMMGIATVTCIERVWGGVL
ncbi:MAG: YeeE/YedE family protein [Myxococcales bacterium]|nr:YeeE/YedE family protein [Myxococcales bacterium]MCB9709001.1 YeeE/YedE family protein [Myxococcales bacterium]